ncbi:hypothetical protein RJT34_06229 [Clitoria ternatea]|uniref:Uncharacterized protein n=1 Tax=Clitoria ternatea TaxID=43366 RepID=A0AAN9K5F5_CLITE
MIIVLLKHTSSPSHKQHSSLHAIPTTTTMGFLDLSDTDDSAIEEIISQAQDACVLDQLSAINCSGITHSVLPTHLETRFRKLKSFPSTITPPTFDPKARSFSILTLKGNPQSPNFSPSKDNPHSGSSSSPSDSAKNKEQRERKPKHGSLSSPPFGSVSASSHSSEESSMSSMFRPTQKDKEQKEKCSSVKSLTSSPSPPRKSGCFWCSPGKKSKKKSKEILGVVNDFGSDELLSDLGSFSRKQQQKMLKKAMKEEEKISREAQKIVEWAKHASARMNVSDIEDEFSDD